jgi:CBS domain-containing protein
MAGAEAFPEHVAGRLTPALEPFRGHVIMANVKDILFQKDNRLLTIEPGASVYDAARLMNEHKVGSLLVMAADRLIGIFTERDILQRVVAQRRDPVDTHVDDVMSAEVICCRPHTSLEEASGVMKNRRVRHLPVVDDDGQVLGIVSIGDLNAYDNHSREQTIHLLHQYISGQV